MKFTSSVLAILSVATLAMGSPTPDNAVAPDDVVEYSVAESLTNELTTRGQGCPFGNKCNLNCINNVHRTCNGKLQYPYKGSCGGFANLTCQCYYHACKTS